MEYKEWEVKASDDPPDCQAVPNDPKTGTKMDWDRQCNKSIPNLLNGLIKNSNFKRLISNSS